MWVFISRPTTDTALLSPLHETFTHINKIVNRETPCCIMRVRLCHAPGWPARWVALLLTRQPRGAPLPGGGAKYIILSLQHTLLILYITQKCIIYSSSPTNHSVTKSNKILFLFSTFENFTWHKKGTRCVPNLTVPSQQSWFVCGSFICRDSDKHNNFTPVFFVLLSVEEKSIRMIFTIFQN